MQKQINNSRIIKFICNLALFLPSVLFFVQLLAPFLLIFNTLGKQQLFFLRLYIHYILIVTYRTATVVIADGFLYCDKRKHYCSPKESLYPLGEQWYESQ